MHPGLRDDRRVVAVDDLADQVRVVGVPESGVDAVVVHGVVPVRLGREDRPERDPGRTEPDRVVQPRLQPVEPVHDVSSYARFGAGEAERVDVPSDGVADPGRLRVIAPPVGP